jgi:TIR domain
MAHDVFISHSSKDKQIADAVCHYLEQNGIRCWIAPRDILPGVDWGEAIIRAITNCNLMILIFSSDVNSSNQVKREVERAVSKGVIIIPFRVENIEPSGSLEYYLSMQHWLDALPPPPDKHFQRLTESAKILLQSTLDTQYSHPNATYKKYSSNQPKKPENKSYTDSKTNPNNLQNESYLRGMQQNTSAIPTKSRKRKGLANVSLILGIISLPIGFFGLISPFFLGSLGILPITLLFGLGSSVTSSVVGGIAIFNEIKNPVLYGSKSRAIVGILLSIIATLLQSLLLILFFLGFIR